MRTISINSLEWVKPEHMAEVIAYEVEKANKKVRALWEATLAVLLTNLVLFALMVLYTFGNPTQDNSRSRAKVRTTNTRIARVKSNRKN